MGDEPRIQTQVCARNIPLAQRARCLREMRQRRRRARKDTLRGVCGKAECAQQEILGLTGRGETAETHTADTRTESRAKGAAQEPRAVRNLWEESSKRKGALHRMPAQGKAQKL